MFLAWITRVVKQAVLQGFREAVEELAIEDGSPDAMAVLQGRMALPAPSSNGEHEKPTRKGKS